MDTVSSKVRSRIMSHIRSKNNASTEKRLRMALVRAGVSGWHLHDRNLPGRPDFVFPKSSLALFVDGCFWHGCPKCGHYPQSNRKYWDAKINNNRLRDRAARSMLKASGWRVLRVWEHEMSLPDKVIKKIIFMLRQQ
jgi:DNA mismatch endonuclease (patch repair protein)